MPSVIAVPESRQALSPACFQRPNESVNQEKGLDMNWYEFERNNVRGITGDKPMSEFASALARIVSSYEEKGARKPTTAELLYALENVLGATPENMSRIRWGCASPL